MKRKLIYLSILVLLVLFACSQKENQKERVEKEEKKILTMAQKAEIKTLDPQKATDSVSRSIIKLINQTLVYIDNEGNIVPDVYKRQGEIYIVDYKTGGKNENQLKTYASVLKKTFKELKNYEIKTNFLEFDVF